MQYGEQAVWTMMTVCKWPSSTPRNCDAELSAKLHEDFGLRLLWPESCA